MGEHAKKRLVVLTGAGISAESGLQTFRDADGLWEGYDVYEVASPIGWQRNPQLVLDFYNMRRRQIREAQPNAAHFALARLEQNYEVRIVTQNIDDLHERAGSSWVLHLHGEIFKMRSERNENLVFPVLEDIRMGDKAPDGAQLRPQVVWFGEPVTLIEVAAQQVRQADIFVLIGSSLNVYPAADLINLVPAAAPKYIIDKKIPPVLGHPHLHSIEQPATVGVQQLLTLL